MKISLLIKKKMPTVVGIFIFISRENFMLSSVEHETCSVNSGPDLDRCTDGLDHQSHHRSHVLSANDAVLLTTALARFHTKR